MSKKLIYKICGIIGMFGCFGVLAADIIGIIVHEAHNPISNTISMLAIGKYGWIQDLGLDLLAGSFFAIAIGFYTWKRSGIKWIISLIILVLISIDLVLIAEHNQYAGRPGYTIHRELVYALALLFPTLLLVISFDLKNLKPFLKKFSWWIAGLWLVLSPLMHWMPDHINGAYERLIGSMLIIWAGILSYNLYYLPETEDDRGIENH